MKLAIEEQATQKNWRKVKMIREDILNFYKLKKSNIPYDFLKKHNGSWSHQDWLDFCNQIHNAGYTPIDLHKVGGYLEHLKDQFLKKTFQ